MNINDQVEKPTSEKAEGHFIKAPSSFRNEPNVNMKIATER
jgi:hypothetical protein